jgi:hypothetical protein
MEPIPGVVSGEVTYCLMKPSPPLLAERLLRNFLRKDLSEEVLGDLEEKFKSTAKQKSLFKAKLNYWFQMINYLRPFTTQYISACSEIILKLLIETYLETKAIHQSTREAWRWAWRWPCLLVYGFMMN